METTALLTPDRRQIPSHRRAPKHRAETPGLAARATRVALAAGRRVLGAGHTPNMAAPHPNVHHAQPVRHERSRLGALRYENAAAERLVKSEHRASAGTLSRHQPLLSREQVQGQLGFVMGELLGAIHLSSKGAPSADTLLYCFNQSSVNEQGDRISRYVFATPRQLAALQADPRNWEAVEQGMLTLSYARGGVSRQTIGRDHWLPGRVPKTPGTVGQVDHTAALSAQTQRVAEQQVMVSIGDSGLIVEDQTGRGGTVVEFNPELIAPQDAWPDAQMQPDWHIANLHT